LKSILKKTYGYIPRPLDYQKERRKLIISRQFTKIDIIFLSKTIEE